MTCCVFFHSLFLVDLKSDCSSASPLLGWLTCGKLSVSVSSSLSLTHCRFLLQWHRLSFVTVPNLTSFFHFFCPQGKTPSPRAAHACATVGNRGFVFGGRYRVSPSPIYQCAAGAQMENFNRSLLCCRSPEWTTFTTWTWIRGSGMKCRY